MASSLRIADLIELLNGGQASELPQCAGAQFRLGREFDFGSPQPVIDFVITLMGDGTRPVGWRVDNRTFTLPVTIIVPSTGTTAAAQLADRLTMVGAREVLLQTISAPQFNLTWSPDGTDGTRNTVFECWRAKASTISWDLIRDKQRISELEISFEAMPYGRSDTLANLNFDSPVQGVTAPATPIVVDDFSTVLSSQQNTWWSQTNTSAYGTTAARWSHALSDQESPLWYVHTIAGTDFTSFDRLSFWFGMGCDTAADFRKWKRGWVFFEIKLTDNTGRVITIGLQKLCDAASNANLPRWNQVSVKIPQGQTFTYTNVVSYSIKAWNEKHHNGNRELNATGYLSGLIASPPAGTRRPASTRGGTYLLYGAEGTAPTTLNVHSQLSFREMIASTVTYTLGGTIGVAQAWTAPAESPNFLFGDTVNGDRGTTGTWVTTDAAATNVQITTTAVQFNSAPFSIRMLPIAGGSDMVMASCLSSAVDTQGVPIAPSEWIQARAKARAATNARTVTISAEFYTSTKALISVVAANNITSTNSTFTALSGKAQAPANSAYARLLVKVTTPSAGDATFIDDLFFSYACQGTVIVVGAGAAGGSVKPAWCGGGGGGGGEISVDTHVALNQLATHSYTIGKGGIAAYSGTTGPDGGNSGFVGQTTTLISHGGKGGVNELTIDRLNGTGGLGGTGSLAPAHFNGGTGGNASTVAGYAWGGGGGAGAGDGGAGGNGGAASGGISGAAGALAITGGHGGAGDHDHGGNGFNGIYPGGGGGGAGCQNVQHAAGNGSNGLVRVIVKTYQFVATFPALVIHVPRAGSTVLAKPVVPVGNGLDTPDGLTDYGCGDVDGQNARYKGTYSVLLIATSFNGAGARTLTVDINQVEQTPGTTSQASISASVDPAALTNKMVNLGEVTLPLKDMADENTDTVFTLNVTSGNTADRFLDVILVDTRGQMIWVNLPGSGYTDYWIDAPELDASVGQVLASMDDRSAATSVLANTIMTGGPLRLVPGENLLTVYSPAGMPALEGDYWPRWWHERLA